MGKICYDCATEKINGTCPNCYPDDVKRNPMDKNEELKKIEVSYNVANIPRSVLVLEETVNKIIDKLNALKTTLKKGGNPMDERTDEEVKEIKKRLVREQEKTHMGSTPSDILNDIEGLLSLIPEKNKKIEELEKLFSLSYLSDKKLFDMAENAIERAYPNIWNKQEKGWWVEKRIPNFGILRGAIVQELYKLSSRIKSLEEGMVEIAKGRGRYDLDNHQHAINTIEDMKAIANNLLEKKGVSHGSSS